MLVKAVLEKTSKNVVNGVSNITGKGMGFPLEVTKQGDFFEVDNTALEERLQISIPTLK